MNVFITKKCRAIGNDGKMKNIGIGGLNSVETIVATRSMTDMMTADGINTTTVKIQKDMTINATERAIETPDAEVLRGKSATDEAGS